MHQLLLTVLDSMMITQKSTTMSACKTPDSSLTHLYLRNVSEHVGMCLDLADESI